MKISRVSVFFVYMEVRYLSEYLMTGERYLRTVLDAFPAPVLIVDRELRIHDANLAARNLLAEEPKLHLRRLCGDLLHCIHARGADGGCGNTTFCGDCVLRQTAGAVADGGMIFRQTSEMKLERDGETREAWFLVTGAPMKYEDNDLVVLTLEDVTELKRLHGILPVCSHCRKIRDDEKYWHRVEDYLEKYTGAKFSHGICPDCFREHYPEMADRISEDRNPERR